MKMNEIQDAMIMVIRPLEPHLEWLAKLGAHTQNQPAIERENLFSDTAVFVEKKPEKLHEFLIEHSEALLTQAFSHWTTNETLWPVRSDAELLLEHFALDFYQHIVDARKGDSEIHYIAVLNPTENMKNWFLGVLSSFEDTQAKPTYADFLANATAYLLPAKITSTALTLKWMQDQLQSIYEYEFNRYIKEDSYWPTLKTPEEFREWFTLEIYPSTYRL